MRTTLAISMMICAGRITADTSWGFLWLVRSRAQDYSHKGSKPLVWYAVPAVHAPRMESAVVHGHAGQKQRRGQAAMISPTQLMKEGIPVYRCVQKPGDIVLTAPGAYHCSWSAGLGLHESVCLAPKIIEHSVLREKQQPRPSPAPAPPQRGVPVPPNPPSAAALSSPSASSPGAHQPSPPDDDGVSRPFPS
jgi:hypothetical protein